MLGWSINLFRLFGIQLAVHATFFLLLAYVAWEGWQDGGLLGLVINVWLTIGFFICVVLHELGHSLTARRYGVKVPRILLTPIGGMAQFDRIPKSPSAELLITAAGPAVNFVIAAALFVFVGLPAGWPWRGEYAESWTGLTQVLLSWNLMMGAFNLLPVFPMDGGRIFRALLARRTTYLRATWWAVAVGRVLSATFAFVAVFYYQHFMLGLLFAFIFIAGNAEYRMVLRREQDEAYWAEVARRVAQSHPSRDDEPPLLSSRPS